MCFSTLNQTINALQKTTHNPNANRIYTIFLQTKFAAWALDAQGGTSQILHMFAGYIPKKSSYIFHPRKNPDCQGRTPIRLWNTAQVTQTWAPSFDLAIVICTTRCMFTTRAVLRAVPVDAGACVIGVSDFTSETDFLACKLLPECHFWNKIQSTPLTKLATQKSRRFFVEFSPHVTNHDENMPFGFAKVPIFCPFMVTRRVIRKAPCQNRPTILTPTIL